MTRLVLISDTHGLHWDIKLPEGDILIHAGDFSHGRGSLWQVGDFNKWLGEQDFAHKILIAGNHDFPFYLEDDREKAVEILSEATYLENSSVTLEGIKFWGSPLTPPFLNWAFMAEWEERRDAWETIPEDTDVVITHGPPYLVGDYTYRGVSAGCAHLRQKLVNISPKLHVCGHIHEGYGEEEIDGAKYVNASICTLGYQPTNKPIIVDI